MVDDGVQIAHCYFFLGIIAIMSENNLLQNVVQSENNLPLKEKLKVVWFLSIPGILAQISEIAMQYIDAAMVGSLGANASASIGLVSSSTWLLGGLLMASCAGFSVQVSHAVGAKKDELARSVFRQGILITVLISLLLCMFGLFCSTWLPGWLGANDSILHDSTMYLRVYSLFIPVRMFYFLNQSALQCTGNMKIPSILSAVMCGLDVLFNYLLIFPVRTISLFGVSFMMYGAGLGVTGAALGTALSYLVTLFFVVYETCWKSPVLTFKKPGSFYPQISVLKEAVSIGIPMACEQAALTLAQVFSTKIISPLGNIAIAANSFAVTAESICYMPGYGIQSASTTLVGQAIGAKKKDLARSFAWITTIMGMVIMSVMGILMYFLCPYVFAFLTSDTSVQELGVSVLRIELLAEPMFAASIVATGAMRGAGDTFVPGLINLISIWGIRITMSYVLSQMMGLQGAWIAMASDLTIRGLLFLIRLKREKWLDRALKEKS